MLIKPPCPLPRRSPDHAIGRHHDAEGITTPQLRICILPGSHEGHDSLRLCIDLRRSGEDCQHYGERSRLDGLQEIGPDVMPVPLPYSTFYLQISTK